MSPCKRCYFLRVLTFHSKLREPNDGIDGCVEFFGCILPQASDTLSPPGFLLKIVIFFLSQNVPPFIRHVVPYLLSYHPLCLLYHTSRLSVSLVISVYICTCTSGAFLLFVLNMPRNCYLGRVDPG